MLIFVVSFDSIINKSANDVVTGSSIEFFLFPEDVKYGCAVIVSYVITHVVI